MAPIAFFEIIFFITAIVPERLSSEFVQEYFTGTSTTIEGVGLAQIAREARRCHTRGFGDKQIYAKHLDVGGDYAYRARGEKHIWNPVGSVHIVTAPTLVTCIFF